MWICFLDIYLCCNYANKITDIKTNIMKNRSQRKNIAENTVQILEQGFYINDRKERISMQELLDYAISNSKLYTPNESDDLLEEEEEDHAIETEIRVEEATTLESVKNLLKETNEEVVYLNFASAKNPGGGYLGGSQAQEESIARATALVPCLNDNFEYYEVNRNTTSGLYTDYMIYSPKVPIFKNEEGEVLDQPVLASIITAPAVNAGAVKKNSPKEADQIETVMKRRIEKVLKIAVKNKYNNIVLGAWGCGVFRNEPNDVAKWFKEVITTKFESSFKKIVFAIYSRDEKFVNAFREEF